MLPRLLSLAEAARIISPKAAAELGNGAGSSGAWAIH